MKLVIFPTNTTKVPGLTWVLALLAAERMGGILGVEGEPKTATEVLQFLGRKLSTRIDYSIVDRIDRCLVDIKMNAAEENDLAVFLKDEHSKAHLKIFVQACRGLLVKDFGAELQKYRKAAGLSKASVARLSGIPLSKVKSWMCRRSKLPTNMTPAQALQLDHALNGGLSLVAAYIATSQQSVFRKKKNVADLVLQRTSFGTLLSQCWKRTSLTKAGLLAKVEADTEIRITESVFTRWCGGLASPTLDKAPAIEAIDGICKFRGELLLKWRATDPRPAYSQYRYQYKQWSPRLKRELAEIVAFKNLEEDSQDESGDDHFHDDSDETATEADLNQLVSNSENGNWRTATLRLFAKKFAQPFFGYLLLIRDDGTLANPNERLPTSEKERLDAKRRFWTGSISFTFMCDWELVEGYFKFLRLRTGRIDYTMWEWTRTTALLSLYRSFFTRWASEAKQQSYWATRIPGFSISEGTDAHVALWSGHLHKTMASAWKFLKTESFTRAPSTRKVQPLLDRQVATWVLAAEIEIRVQKRPTGGQEPAICL